MSEEGVRVDESLVAHVEIEGFTVSPLFGTVAVVRITSNRQHEPIHLNLAKGDSAAITMKEADHE